MEHSITNKQLIVNKQIINKLTIYLLNTF